MKKLAAIVCVLVICTLSGVSSVFAGMYYSGNMGVVVGEDARLDDGTDTGDLSFDDGFAATGALGHTLGKNARLEMELGYRINDLDKVSLDSGGDAGIDGDMTTISLMGNAYYDFLTESAFKPFVGAGAGVANIEAEIGQLGDDDDTVFAYQFAAGGTFAVNDNLNIDIQYRYFATEDPDFDGVKTEYNTHNLFLGLRLSF